VTVTFSSLIVEYIKRTIQFYDADVVVANVIRIDHLAIIFWQGYTKKIIFVAKAKQSIIQVSTNNENIGF
jgi:hypothetical protein